MVAILNTNYSIGDSFYYNQNKEDKDKAECILAENYPLDLQDLNKHNRLKVLLKIAERAPQVRRNCVHISLNFAIGEQLSTSTMQQIAREYMQGIGFAHQPFLVYRHRDAGHEHMHIVTTKIRADGTRIETQNIGRNQSETARKAIEIKYGLVRAEEHKGQVFRMKPVDVQKAVYGQIDTRNAIQNVLAYVLNRYSFRTVGQLNAVLNLYNVHADIGSEGSRVRKHNGLLYRLLDDQGKPAGKAIKASAFFLKAKMTDLNKRFRQHQQIDPGNALRVKNAVDLIARTPNTSIQKLSTLLKRQGIILVQHRGKQNVLFGISYVDHRQRAVYGGRELGESYAAAGILARFSDGPANTHGGRTPVLIPQNPVSTAPITGDFAGPIDGLSGALESLLQPEITSGYLPYELRAKKKRKKRKGNNNTSTQ